MELTTAFAALPGAARCPRSPAFPCAAQPRARRGAGGRLATIAALEKTAAPQTAAAPLESTPEFPAERAFAPPVHPATAPDPQPPSRAATGSPAPASARGRRV